MTEPGGRTVSIFRQKTKNLQALLERLTAWETEMDSAEQRSRLEMKKLEESQEQSANREK